MDVTQLRWEQSELNKPEPKVPSPIFVCVVASQLLLFPQCLYESKVKIIPYIQHQLISVYTNYHLSRIYVEPNLSNCLIWKYFDIIGPCHFKDYLSTPSPYQMEKVSVWMRWASVSCFGRLWDSNLHESLSQTSDLSTDTYHFLSRPSALLG